MSRVTLLHFDPDRNEERVERLHASGHDIEAIVPKGSPSLRRLFDEPPDTIVIDLGRRPSEGRYIGIYLRQRKPTRAVPLVFVDGEGDRLEAVRQSLPDAIYTDWERVAEAVDRALAAAPYEPVVPPVPGFYTGASLVEKLNVRAGRTLALVDTPEGFAEKLEPLPDGVTVRHDARAEADLIVLFVRRLADLRSRFPVVDRKLSEGGGVWVCWPKKVSDVDSDLSQQKVRAFGLGEGFVDYKIAAIDDTWSGLLFSRRDRGEDDEG